MLSRVTFRAISEIKGNKLGGYAAVYNEIAPNTDMGPEKLAEGSLTEALAVSDIRALYNHSVMHVLGRMSSGTMRAQLDSKGLEYEVDLPNTTYANDLRELVTRGDITGASFGFIPDAYEYDAANILVHTRVAEIIDASPVTFPAYASATASLRHRTQSVYTQREQLIRLRNRLGKATS